MDGLRRAWAAFDDRVGVSAVFMPIIRHPVPPTVGAISWAYVFGSATLVSFMVAVITGIPLAAQYIPSTGQAYQSIEWINSRAIFGYQIRAIHYFSANAMMVMIGIHMFRVFLMGSYKYPREVNWILGVILLFLTAGIVFTGQILRWDQVGVYTVMITVFQGVRTPWIGNWVGDLLLGGNTITGVTVSRFYALHVFILPGLLFAVIGFHLYMVIHAGISEPPKSGRPVDPKSYRAWYHNMLKRDGVPFWPDAAWRDVSFGIAVLLGITILAITVGAPPLAGPPNPADIHVIPRPDWYFLWYFAALALIPPPMENVVMLAAPLGLIVGLLLLPIWANKGERSPARRPWAMITVLCSGLMIFSLTLTGALAPWSPNFNATPLPAKIIGATSGAVFRGGMLFHTAGCEDCHSVGGYGGLRGPDLTNVGGRLTSSDMIIRIMNGGENMPSFARILSATELSDLVAFLESRTVYTKYGLGGQARPAPTVPTGAKGAQNWITFNAAKHTATLTLIAGYSNAVSGFNFNGYGNGQMTISVPEGYHVTVNFSNQGLLPHSALITPSADKNLPTNFPLAFPGAASTNPGSGITKGQTSNFSFVANKAGTYALVCGVPGHAAAGMWDAFKVTSGGQPSVATPSGLARPAPTSPVSSGQAAPTSTPPSTAKGKGQWISWNAASHAATVTLIAGYSTAISGFNFNGYGKGQMVISVPEGYHVMVNFSNQGLLAHSAVITPNADKSRTSNFPLAFPGAGSTNPGTGITKGQTSNFSFTANKAGTYALVCAVPGHEAAGMWDVFKVTSGGQPSVTTPSP